MSVVTSVLAAVTSTVIAGAMWRPALDLLRSPRPRWMVVATPMVVAATLAAAMAGPFHGVLVVLAVSVWGAGSAWLVLIDVAERHLPWRLSSATTLALLILFGIQGILNRSPEAWVRALLAGVVVTAVLFALAWWSRGRLGLGDVGVGMPIAVLLGWLGWRFVWCGVGMGFVVGGLVAVVLLATGRGRRAEFPFGPCMVAGAVLGTWLSVAT